MSLQPLTFEAFKRLPMAEPKPLIASWLHEASYTQIQAAPKAGKTWAALGIALTVAGGGQFLGYRAPEPRKVIYIDAENGQRMMLERLKRLVASLPGLDLEAVKRNLYIMGPWLHDDKHGESPFPLIDGTGGSQDYIDVARDFNAALMVLDTKAKLHSVRSENEAAQDATLSRTIDRLKAIGCAVLLLHHTAQNANAFDPSAGRGTSALPGSVDLLLGLKKRPKAGTGTLSSFRLAVAGDCTRHGVALDVTARLEEDAGGHCRWFVDGEKPQAEDDVSKMLRIATEGVFKTDRALEQRCGFSQGRVHKLCAKAESEGRLKPGQLKQLREAAVAG
jgi:hypothetical protein